MSFDCKEVMELFGGYKKNLDLLLLDFDLKSLVDKKSQYETARLLIGELVDRVDQKDHLFEIALWALKQYHYQRDFFLSQNLLSFDKEFGASYVAVDGERYVYPKWEEVLVRLIKNRLNFKKDLFGSFKPADFRLRIFPTGMDMKNILDAFTRLLGEFSDRGMLFDTTAREAWSGRHLTSENIFFNKEEQIKTNERLAQVFLHNSIYHGPWFNNPPDRSLLRTKEDLLFETNGYKIMEVINGGEAIEHRDSDSDPVTMDFAVSSYKMRGYEPFTIDDWFFDAMLYANERRQLKNRWGRFRREVIILGSGTSRGQACYFSWSEKLGQTNPENPQSFFNFFDLSRLGWELKDDATIPVYKPL